MSNFFLENSKIENLHHAYLIEGNKENIVAKLISFLKENRIEIKNNPDFHILDYDDFKIIDIKNINHFLKNKSLLSKKIFCISANSFSKDAQNAFLKTLEDPLGNTHFFIIVPNSNFLLKTFLSRFFVVKENHLENLLLKEAEYFINLSYSERINFIKDFYTKSENLEDNARIKVLDFLDGIESILYRKYKNNTTKEKICVFEHIFNTREYLRENRNSKKSLAESLVFNVPKL